MNTHTQKFLHQLNNHFYRAHGASFADTRGAPWQGWQRCVEVLAADGAFASQATPYSVLDLACGNKRFETFLEEALPEFNIKYYGVDNSSEMAGDERFQDFDVLGQLMVDGADLQDVSKHIDAPACDLSVSFGFMHHIPSQKLRRSVIDLMLEKAKSGGYLVISFWQFLRSEELAAKAEITHAQGLRDLAASHDKKGLVAAGLHEALEVGDYFLGWQGRDGAYRYCHSFAQEEIDELLEAVADRAELISRFDADGRTSNLNAYTILRKSE